MSLIKRILKISYGAATLMIVAFCIFPQAIARIYTDIPDLARASVPAMIVMCTSYFINTGAQIFFNAVSGTGSTRTAFKLELAALIIYVGYCTLVIHVIRADVAVCWTAEHVYAGILLLFSWRFMKSGRWKNRIL